MALNLIFNVTDRATPEVRRLERSLSSLDRSVGQTERTFLGFDRNLVRTVAGFVALDRAIDGGRFLLETADNFTLLNSRLALVTDSTQQLTEAQRALFAVSQDTRTQLEGTIDLYTRIARSTQDYGTTQRELVDLTRTINQALIISGGNAQSAEAAIVQLGQAFSANFQAVGQELASIREQAPRVYQALLEGTGQTSQGFRELAEQGRLTSEIIINALQSQAGAVNQEFSRIELTVGQANTQVSNAFVNIIGRFNEVSGATNSLAQEISSLSGVLEGISTDEISDFLDGLSFIGSVALNTALAIGTFRASLAAYNVVNALVGRQNIQTTTTMNFLGQATTRTTIATNALRVSLNTIPFLAIATGIGLIATSLLEADEGTTALSGSYEELSNNLAGLTRDQLEYRQSLIETELIQARLALANARADVASEGFFESEEEIRRDRAHLDEVRARFRDLQRLSGDVREAIAGISSEVQNVALSSRNIVITAQIDDDQFAEFEREYEQLNNRLVRDTLDFTQELRNLSRSTTELEREELQRRFEQNREYINESSILYENYANRIIELDRQIAVEHQQRQIEKLEQEGTFLAGVEASALRYQETMSGSFGLGEEAFRSFTSNASDALLDFTRSGEERFRNFTRSVILDIARMVVQEQVAAVTIRAIEASKLAFKTTAESTKQALVATTTATEITNNQAATANVLANETTKTSAAATTSAVSSMQGIPFPLNLAALAATVGAITSIISGGFANGGYTGNGGKYEPAGTVHKGEYVFTKEQTQRIGVSNLEAIANGRGYQKGGFVGELPLVQQSIRNNVSQDSIGNPNINVIVNNNAQDLNINASSRRSEGGDIDIIVEIVDEELSARINRGEATLGQTLESRYNLDRG